MTNYTGRIDESGAPEIMAPIMEAEMFDIEHIEGTFDDVMLYFEDGDGNYLQIALRGGWPHRSSTKSTDFAAFLCDEIGYQTTDD